MDAPQAPPRARRGLIPAALGLAAAAAGLGLCGLRWGLPSRARLERVEPPGLETPAEWERLESGWRELHRRLGPNLMTNPASFSGLPEGRVPAGWTRPPEALENALRSFHLRSALDDEQTYLLMLSRMRPWRLEFDPHMFAYGGTHIYAYGAALAAAAAARLVPLHASLEPYLSAPGEIARLYLVGRALSFLAYLGAAALLFWIGLAYFDPLTGALAAWFFLVCPAAIVNEHTLKVHSFWAFFALLTTAAALRLLRRGGTGAYAAAGAAAGATVGSFLPAGGACLVVGAAALLRAARGERRGALAKGVLAAALACVVVFLLTNPYYVLRAREVFAELSVFRASSHGLPPGGPLRYLLGPLRRSMSEPTWALMLAGLVWGLLRLRREPALFACAVFFCVALACTFSVGGYAAAGYSRYFLGWLGLGCLLAARAASEGFARLRPPILKAAAALALSAIAVDAGVLGAAYVRNYRLASESRGNLDRAGDWIDANVAPAQPLGLLRPVGPSETPYFRLDRHTLWLLPPERFAAAKPAELPEFLVIVRPDYDERPQLEPNLSRYEPVAEFARARLLWRSVEPTSTPANPEVDVYRLKKRGARKTGVD